MTDYPQGDGVPDCALCQGRGVIPAPAILRNGVAVEQTRPCDCILVRDVLANLERGWPGLVKAAPIKSSPLRGKEKTNLWLTATGKQTKEHIKHVAARMGPQWGFLVVTDADLMDAWLSRIKARDPDVDQLRENDPARRDKYDGLVDMTEPPELLIIRVGIKAARNEAMPEVLLETLQHRDHLSKPTWVIDQHYCRLREGDNISYSRAVIEFLSDWDRIEFENNGPGQGFTLQLPTGVRPEMVQELISPPRSTSRMQDLAGEAEETEPPAFDTQPVLAGQTDKTRSMLKEEDMRLRQDRKKWGGSKS